MTDKRIFIVVFILLSCIVAGVVKITLTEKVEMNPLVKDMKVYRHGKEVHLEDETMCKLSQIIAKMVEDGLSADGKINSAMKLETDKVDNLESVEDVIIVEFKKVVYIEHEYGSPKIKCVALCMEELAESIYCFQDELAKCPQWSCKAYHIPETVTKNLQTIVKEAKFITYPLSDKTVKKVSEQSWNDAAVHGGYYEIE